MIGGLASVRQVEGLRLYVESPFGYPGGDA